jgi:hypothetical protein
MMRDIRFGGNVEGEGKEEEEAGNQVVEKRWTEQLSLSVALLRSHRSACFIRHTLLQIVPTENA